MPDYTAPALRMNATAYRALQRTDRRARHLDTTRKPSPPGGAPPTDLHRIDLLTASADAAARTASTIATILEPLDTRQAASMRRRVAGLTPDAAWAWSATVAARLPPAVAEQVQHDALAVLTPIVRYLGGHPGIPALLTCPHCTRLTVTHRPRLPDVLTCTNPHCAPAPRTWSLRKGEWSGIPELT